MFSDILLPSMVTGSSQMKIEIGKGQNNKTIVVLSPYEARTLVKAILSALTREHKDGWGDSLLFRVLVDEV